jgi:superfamily II DNA or RNA helicase
VVKPPAMPKLKSKNRRAPSSEKVTAGRSRSQGWLTTDEEEIERRRQRAAVEPLAVQALEPEHPVFGTFHVASEGGNAYEVEIRSLSEPENSCSCPDHQVNGLGTCKHVETVLVRVGRSRKAREGNRRIEIFLRRTSREPEVHVVWPAGAGRLAGGVLVGKFFDEGGTLRGDPVAVLPVLARELAALAPRARKRVRLSRLLPAWIEERRRCAARQTARERFLAEVSTGRQTLDVLKHPLFPYQQEGMLHLAFTERALLADEMGLGKTVQAIAACELLRRLRGVERVLVVSPASLKGEWEEQISRFSDLPSQIVQGPREQRLRQYGAGKGDGQGAFFHLMNYEQILIDGEEVQRRLAPDVVILDEAQRIKNWQSRTAQAVKRLRSPYAFVLTGTPIENRIDEIYSIVQFLDPGLFGPLFRFNRDFYKLDDRGRPAGYKNLDELHRRLAPILLRRRKEEVEGQLPQRTDKHYFVPMEEEQLARYAEYERRVAQLASKARRRPLSPEELARLQRWLSCMRMLCDTPYILDSDCRTCPKLPELEEILEDVLTDPQAKALVFSEWERMLELVRELALEMGIGFAWHTGSVSQDRRRADIRRFKSDPACRLFLSTDSGGVGLNLQAASVVINLDLPWNPARLEQRIARAWRKHQTRPVQVIHLVTEGSIEHRMIPLLAGKQALADSVLDSPGERSEMPLPSGRKALIERLEALTGIGTPAQARPPKAESLASTAPETVREELLASLGLRLLRLETGVSREGRETLLAVVDRAAAGELSRVEALLAQRFEGTSPAPHLEMIDDAAFAAIERLIEAGWLQLSAEGRRLLHRSPAAGEPDTERERRLARARETFAQAERKIRMAAVLAEGGFPVEALPSLREGAELGLCSWAHLEGAEVEGFERVPLDWIEGRLPRHLPLMRNLRGEPEALLATREDDVRTWIAAAEQLADEIRSELPP